ncbi:hypothetical protein [Halorussus lipolyticus]|uniref:hypothetical protein n=1 Tax=Halorussus lipolyticus TaxID=3034024 RepID=UPI0023E864DA|nr:hypothetical protein [Halorussus sp. DT80]
MRGERQRLLDLNSDRLYDLNGDRLYDLNGDSNTTIAEAHENRPAPLPRTSSLPNLLRSLRTTFADQRDAARLASLGVRVRSHPAVLVLRARCSRAPETIIIYVATTIIYVATTMWYCSPKTP